MAIALPLQLALALRCTPEIVYGYIALHSPRTLHTSTIGGRPALLCALRSCAVSGLRYRFPKHSSVLSDHKKVHTYMVYETSCPNNLTTSPAFR